MVVMPLSRLTINARRGAQAGAEPEKKRRIAYVAHDDVGECDVLNRPAVNAFECKAAAILEHAIADHNVLETTARFCTAFDASRRLPVIGQGSRDRWSQALGASCLPLAAFRRRGASTRRTADHVGRGASRLWGPQGIIRSYR